MTIPKYSLVFLLLVSLLAGCKVSKDIEKPDTALPAKFRNAPAIVSIPKADMPWKAFFTDRSLQLLLDSAIARNHDMQLAVKNIEIAQLLLTQTRWAYVPNATLAASATTNRPSGKSLNGLSAKQFLGTTHVEDYTANISLSWEADIWGKIKNRRASALAEYLQTEEAKKAIQTNIVASVSQGFYNLLMLDAQLAIARKNISLNDSTLRIIRMQYDAGQVTALAIQQAEAQQLSAAALVPVLEQKIEMQENALSYLAGRYPDSIKRSSTLYSVDVPRSLSAGVPAEMVARRPDVKRYELALFIANAQVGITKANMYPTLNITANGGVNAFKVSDWFNIPAALFGVVTGGIVQPLLQKKQLATAYKIALLEREKTVIEFRQSVLFAVGEVSDALSKIEKLENRESTVVHRVSTLQTAIGNARLLFSTGMANYLEVITAQSNLLESELELAAIKLEQLSAKVDLYRALGGGWK